MVSIYWCYGHATFPYSTHKDRWTQSVSPFWLNQNTWWCQVVILCNQYVRGIYFLSTLVIRIQSTLWCIVPIRGDFFCLTLVPFINKFDKILFFAHHQFYTANKSFNNETVFWRTTLCLKVYLLWFNATLHAPKIWAVVQTSFLQSVHLASVGTFHCPTLLGEGRIFKVEARQKETVDK